MRRRPSRTWLIAIAVGLAVLAAGCGETSHGPPPEDSADDQALVVAEALGSAEAERELERRDEAPQIRTAVPEFGFRSSPFARFTQIQRMRDAAFDKLFEKTALDRVVDELPFREPPLNVRQWVFTDRSPTLDTIAARRRFYRMSAREQLRLLTPKLEHTLYARVDEKQFYALSEQAREAAVRTFYRAADALFRKAGIRDFVLVVSPLTESVDKLPALAVGRDGTATLTLLGRARPGNGT